MKSKPEVAGLASLLIIPKVFVWLGRRTCNDLGMCLGKFKGQEN